MSLLKSRVPGTFRVTVANADRWRVGNPQRELGNFERLGKFRFVCDLGALLDIG
jgi:hypothetical protein